MGIDIQMFAEVFDGERWRPAETLVENEDYDPISDPLEPRLRPQSLYVPRNRALFAILTEDIASPRGIPGDLSQEIAAIERPWCEHGLFNHSWLTLEELLAFDWKRRIVQMSGLVDPDVASLFDDNPLGFPYADWPKGKPVSYSKWKEGTVDDRGWKPFEQVNVRWRETPEQLAGPDFMEEVLPKLKSFGPTKSVRIVFWFDY